VIQAAAISAYLVGMAGAAMLAAYVVLSGLGVLPRDEPAASAWPYVVNGGWLLLFAGQHSGMARQSFKRLIPAKLERALYVLASGVLTLALPVVWQLLPGPNLWEGQYWLWVLGGTGAIGMVFCCGLFDHLEFFGLPQAGIGGAAPGTGTLRTDGPYRWVRHPLMLANLAFLWGQPTMPPELVMLNAGLTVYILIAIQLEECDLVRQFGQVYVDYRQRVPALIPWRLGR
jgi:protein-S-isoprenylcysteine O-methyltransferase Ste14